MPSLNELIGEEPEKKKPAPRVTLPESRPAEFTSAPPASLLSAHPLTGPPAPPTRIERFGERLVQDPLEMILSQLRYAGSFAPTELPARVNELYQGLGSAAEMAIDPAVRARALASSVPGAVDWLRKLQPGKIVEKYPVSTALTVLPLGMAAASKASSAARLKAATAVGEGAELVPAEERALSLLRGSPGARPAPRLGEIARYSNLDPEQAAVQESFAATAEANPQAIIDVYRREHGVMINPDLYKNASPAYRNAPPPVRRRLAAAVHETGSQLAKLDYEQRVQMPPAPGQENTVRLMAGGTGSGKTRTARTLANQGNPQIVYDASLSNHATAKKLIEQALEGGKNVQLIYVYRDPVESFLSKTGGVLTRSMGAEGRMPPIREHVASHLRAPDTMVRLLQEYGDNPRVDIKMFVNSETAGQSELTAEGLRKIASTINPETTNDVTRKITAGVDEALAEGRITPDVVDFAKSQLATSTQGLRPHLGADLGGDAAGVQQPGRGVPGLTPSSRLNQIHPDNIETLARIEQDPEYLRQLADLGGGRVVGHAETVMNALRQPPMTADELASWPARRAVNEVDVLRGGILRSRLWSDFQDALFKDRDYAHAAELEQQLLRIEPGWNNLTATPGRSLEIQKLLQMNNDLHRRIMELRERNVPFETARAQLDPLLAQLRQQAGTAKDPWRWNIIRRLENYATIAKLTSPVTHAVNTISNAMTYVSRGLEQTVGGLIVGGPEGKAIARTAWGTTQGFRDAARKAREAFWADPEAKLIETRKLRPLSEKFPALAPLQKGARPLNPYRWLSAADAFWKGAIHDATINSLATELAASEGLTGAAAARRIEYLRQNPLTSWKERAEAQALEYTFQENPDRALAGMQAIVDALPGGRLVVPFLKTPYNLVRYQVRRTPLGLLGERTRSQLVSKTARDRADAIGRLVVGTGLTAGALATAWSSEITGRPPKDPNEKAMWDAEGRRPWSIRVGNYWLSYNRFSPQGLYLGQVADIVQALKEGDEKRAESLYWATIATLGSQLKDHPFMQGLSSVLDALDDPARFSDRLVQGTVTGIIPNILRDVRQQVDPALRRPDSLREAIAYMIPGMQGQARERVDVLGRSMTAPQNRLARATKALSEGPSEPDYAEATRAFREASWAPTLPEPTLVVGSNRVTLEGEEATQFQREMGEATLRATLAVSRRPWWKTADMDRRADGLKDAVDQLRRPVRERWKRRYSDQLRPARTLEEVLR